MNKNITTEDQEITPRVENNKNKYESNNAITSHKNYRVTTRQSENEKITEELDEKEMRYLILST